MTMQMQYRETGDAAAERGHHYQATAWWTADCAGLAKSDSAPNAIHFAAPPEFGGLQGRWTPETLFLSAIASCFTTTFQAVAGYAHLDYTDLEVEVEGTIDKLNSGYGFTMIVIRPRLTIVNAEKELQALEILEKAKTLCLVSRALGVSQDFRPCVQAGKAALAG
jgi:organic hydroperoxide reductase OsmC/OhrA